MQSKSNKLVGYLIAIVMTISIGLTIYHYRDKFNPPKPNYETLGYVQIEATITNVFLSGQGTRLKTRLMLQYKYEGERYTDTLELGGNLEDRYNKGDTITRWLDPKHPEKLIGN